MEANPNDNILKIELYPENKPRYEFEKSPIKNIVPKDVLDHSLDEKKKFRIYPFQCANIKWIL